MPAFDCLRKAREDLIATRQPQRVQGSQVVEQSGRVASRLPRGVCAGVQHEQTSLSSSSFCFLEFLRGRGREGRKKGEGEGLVQNFGEEGDTKAADVEVGQEGEAGEGRNEGVEEGDVLARIGMP